MAHPPAEVILGAQVGKQQLAVFLKETIDFNWDTLTHVFIEAFGTYQKMKQQTYWGSKELRSSVYKSEAWGGGD